MGNITEQLRDLVYNKHFEEAAFLCEKIEKFVRKNTLTPLCVNEIF